MHMFSDEKDFYGGHGIVGAQVPLGTGLAFANKYRGNDSVCLTYFGDGAANQGQVYESFNMAELWKLPVDLRHREQRYAMGTSVERASAADRSLQARRRASASPASRSTAWTCSRCSGAAESARRACAAAARARSSWRCKTYRYRGHSMSDPAKYRTREEVQKMRERARPDRARAQALLEELGVERGRAEGDRQGDQATIVDEAAEFAAGRRPSPSRPSSAPTSLVGERLTWPIEILMPALSPTMEEGNARQMAEEGRRHGQVRRRPRRDRDRQGDDGGRGGRRGHDRARSWSPRAPTA